MGYDRMKFSEKLRRYLGLAAEYEGGLRRVAERAGIDRASLEVFVNGQRGLSIENIDKLINYLELDLVAGTSKYSIVLGEYPIPRISSLPQKEATEKKFFVDDGKPF